MDEQALADLISAATEAAASTILPKIWEVCAVCNIFWEDLGYPMTPIEVTVASEDGHTEEGFASVRRYYCGDCMNVAARALRDLGFYTHHHGGIDFLEDDTCSYGTCQTPTERMVVVGYNGRYQDMDRIDWRSQ